jgi:hypothetical protein
MFHTQFQKIQELRNRRLQDPTSPGTVPPALDLQLMKRARQQPLAQEMTELLDKARIRSEALHRLEGKMQSGTEGETS